MCTKERINCRLLLILGIIGASVFQSGVDFQLSMFIYYPPKFTCIVPSETDYIASVDNCYYSPISNSSDKRACTAWAFDTSQINSNIVMDMLLICEKQYLQLIIVPITSILAMLAIGLAYLSDLKGRKIMFIICSLMDIVVWVLIGLTHSSYIAHVILRCLKCFGISAPIIGFVLISELWPERSRDFILINYYAFFSLGISVSTVYFKYMMRWNYAWLLSAWPMIFYFAGPFLLLESPRWLLINNRRQSATDTLKVLGQHSEGDKELEVPEINPEVEGEKGFYTSKVLMLRLIILMFTSLSFNLVYQGTSTNLEFAMSNIYLNAMIMGFVELPAGILSYLSSKYIGSVTSITCWTIIAAVTMLCIPDNWNPSLTLIHAGQVAHIVLACFSKFFLIIGWNILAVFYVGLFPTKKRTFAYNISSMTGYVGVAIGGFIGYYYKDTVHSQLQISNIIYGVILIVAIIVFGIFIPSVNDIDLPDTVNEARSIKKTVRCGPCGNGNDKEKN